MAERKKPGPKTAAKPRRKPAARPRKPRARKPESAAEEAALPNVPEEPLPAPVEQRVFSSPVNLPPPDTPLPQPLRWTTTVILVASLFLAVFNAGALRGWAYQLDETPLSARVVIAVEAWFDVTAALGLDRPVATLHGWWEGLKMAGAGEPETPPPTR